MMSSIMDVITKIKTFLNEEVASEETALVDVKTDDGTILSFDALEVGKEIFVVDQAGRTPAPDGDYNLEDGTLITVKDGLIETVTAPAEAPETETPEVEVEVETPAPAPAEMMSLEDLTSKVKKLEEDNVQLAEIVKQLAETLNTQNFKEEVKMSMQKNQTPEVVENKIASKNKSNLNNIFVNMYK